MVNWKKWVCPQCGSVYADADLTYGAGDAGPGQPAWCVSHDPWGEMKAVSGARFFVTDRTGRLLTRALVAVRAPDRLVPGICWRWLAAEEARLERERERLELAEAEDLRRGRTGPLRIADEEE